MARLDGKSSSNDDGSVQVVEVEVHASETEPNHKTDVELSEYGSKEPAETTRRSSSPDQSEDQPSQFLGANVAQSLPGTEPAPEAESKQTENQDKNNPSKQTSKVKLSARISAYVQKMRNSITSELGEYKRMVVRAAPSVPGRHESYGSLSPVRDVVSDPQQQHNDNQVIHAPMISDVHQRQPLLSQESRWDMEQGGGGVENGSYQNGVVGEMPNGRNGMVKIDVPAPTRDEPKFPKEKLKTLLAALFFVFDAFLNMVALATIHDMVPNRTMVDPLPDIVLDNVTTQEWGLPVSEYIIIFATWSGAFLILIHKHRWIIFRRVFMIMGLLYLMRSITMTVTVLPVASKTYFCSPQANHTTAAVVFQRVWRLISGLGLSINGKHTYCGDFIFSGHTVVLTMSYLVVKEYTPRRCYLIHWLSLALSVFGVAVLLIARGHYTVDVVIAYYATTRIFWFYHTLADNKNLKFGNGNNYLSRVWWWRIFFFFEKNVSGPLPRQYEWPLSWPRRWSAKSPERNS